MVAALLVVLALLLIARVCASIAAERGESSGIGFVLGLLLGPLALVALRDAGPDPDPAEAGPDETDAAG